MFQLAKHRISQLQILIQKQNIPFAFFFHYTEISYFTASHFGDILCIPASSEPILFVRKANERIHNFHKNYLKTVDFRSFSDILTIIPSLKESLITVPYSTLPMDTYKRIFKDWSIPIDKIMDGQIFLNQITLIKTPYEIELMKNTAKDITHILSSLKKEDCLGKTEAEISGLLYAQLRKYGFIGEYQFRSSTPFTGPCVLTKSSILQFSSAHTTYSGYGNHPHLATGSGKETIEKDSPFIIDIMHNKYGLFVDITRTFIIGQPSKELEHRYIALKKINQFIKDNCLPNTTCAEVYNKTLLYVKSLGYQDHFMGLHQDKSLFIGHNIGNWVDEFPAFSKNATIPLQEGMTFALEPKLYFEDYNSPGLESTFVQTALGVENLCSLNEEIITL